MPHTKKRFGQHFLHEKAIIQHIIQVMQPHKDHCFIEIGPGQGALTFPLLKMIDHLDVIELDRDLIPALTRHTGLTVHPVDALTFDFNQLHPGKMLRIFGNLPYNISTPLIFHLLGFSARIQDMHFMLQKEVVDRLAASPGTKAYGRLSVMVQYYCAVTALFDVPPESFYPPPKVESSVVRLVPYQTLPIVATNFTQFENIVRLAFNQRRKTLRNSLSTVISDEDWMRCQINSNLRAEELSVKDFVELSEHANLRDR